MLRLGSQPFPSSSRWRGPLSMVECALKLSIRKISSDSRDAIEYVNSIRHTLPSISQAMLEDGVLDQVDHVSKTEAGRTVLASYISRCRNGAERQEVVVGFTMLVNRFRMGMSHCEACLYPKVRCVCMHVRRVTPRNKLWLFQHVGEYGRNNNTGSLLCLVAGAERTIRGIQEEEDRLLSCVESNPFSTAILFPSKESMTLDEFREQRALEMGKREDEGIMLVLLDGTSRQAKNFDRFMPRGIPRVRVNERKDGSWLDPIRRQTEEHRVCTAQAAAMMLNDLGDQDASRAIEEAVKSVLQVAQMRRNDTGTQGRKEKKHPSSIFRQTAQL